MTNICDKLIYNSSKNLLVDLLDRDKTIILYGPGGCGKSYLINECRKLIDEKGYNISIDGDLKKNIFTNKHVVAIHDINELRNIIYKYYLINMN